MLVQISTRLQIAVVLVAALSACGQPSTSTSAVKDDQPAANSTTAPQAKAAASSPLGDTTLNLADYVTARQAAITPPSMNDVLAVLPAKCDGSAGDGTTVALSIAGACQEFGRAEALAHLKPLVEALAAYGIDVKQVLAAEQEIPAATAQIADPKIDLAAIVPAQTALVARSYSNRALVIPADDHVGGIVGPFNFGSDQFGVTLNGRAQMAWKSGVGLDTGIDASGKVFGNSMELLTSRLQGSALDGSKATITGTVRILGQDVINRTLTEPEYSRSGTFAEFNRSTSGTLHFTLGAVPFGVTWRVSLAGSVPWEIAVAATEQSASLTPKVKAAVSVEGGPDIVVAKAGVGGQFTLLDSTLTNGMNSTLKTVDGAPNFCYRINSSLQSHLLAGNLGAFAEVGFPDKSLFGKPLGWRGNIDFVRWDGISNTMPIFATGDTPVCVH